MRKPILTFLVAAMLLGGLAWGSDKSGSEGQAPAGPWEEYSLEAALTELEIDYGLWLEMELAGVRPEVERLEKSMLSLLSFDIYVSQERVRELAKAAAQESQAGDQVSPKQQLEQGTEFQKSLSELNSKEALYRAVRRTKAFSNKYRLLGDYINLLRRELELPRLKLANEKVTDPLVGGTGTNLPTHK